MPDSAEVDKERQLKVSKLVEVLSPELKRRGFNASQGVVQALDCNQMLFVGCHAKGCDLGKGIVRCRNEVTRLCLDRLADLEFTV